MEEINELLAKIGNRIVKLRKQKRIKQIDLAIMSNIDDGSLRRIEEGRTNPTIKTLTKIAKGLGVDVREFFDVKQEYLISQPDVNLIENINPDAFTEKNCTEFLKEKGYLVFKQI